LSTIFPAPGGASGQILDNYLYEFVGLMGSFTTPAAWRDTCTMKGVAPEGQSREGNKKTMAKKLKKSKKLESNKTLVTVPGVYKG